MPMIGISMSPKVGFPGKKPPLSFSGHGWLNPENRRILELLLPREGSVVEVGTWLGLSTRFMCDVRPLITVYAVDHWLGSPEHVGVPEWEAFIPTLWDQFVVDCWEYRHRIIPVRADSCDGMEWLRDEGMDPTLVYIDGGHAYDTVLADIITARRLWPNAQIVGDDWGWEGPREAATHVSKHHGLELHVDGNCWWFV